jgi:hypothetical protein
VFFAGKMNRVMIGREVASKFNLTYVNFVTTVHCQNDLFDSLRQICSWSDWYLLSQRYWCYRRNQIGDKETVLVSVKMTAIERLSNEKSYFCIILDQVGCKYIFFVRHCQNLRIFSYVNGF